MLRESNIYHICYASLQAIKDVRMNHQPIGLVWRDEGRFKRSRWVFNRHHRDNDYRALIICPDIADELLHAYKQCGPKSRRAFEKMIKKSRLSLTLLTESTLRQSFHRHIKEPKTSLCMLECSHEGSFVHKH